MKFHILLILFVFFVRFVDNWFFQGYYLIACTFTPR